MLHRSEKNLSLDLGGCRESGLADRRIGHHDVVAARIPVPLRARFTAVQQLEGKLAAFRRVYRKDKTIDEELIRVNNLLFKPIDLFNKAFADVDGHCGEILTVLRNLDQTITYIRESRDALHARLMSWDDILKRWTEVSLEISVANEGMIKEIYLFLAQNYLTTKSW